MALPNITVTTLDFQRISDLLGAGTSAPPEAIERLDAELARATLVASTDIAADVVTMNSRVRVEEELSGITREVALVYPPDANSDAGRVSVFSPIGSALLGLKVGQAIDWCLGKGPRMRYRVLAVPYQPEAAGNFEL